PLSLGASPLGCAAAGDAVNKLRPAAATAVAVEAFRKSRREPRGESRSESVWSCGFPSSHILHMFHPSYRVEPCGVTVPRFILAPTRTSVNPGLINSCKGGRGGTSGSPHGRVMRFCSYNPLKIGSL